MTAIEDIVIPLERIEDLGRKLYLSGDSSTLEQIEEYRSFVDTTVDAVAKSEETRLSLAVYLGIVSPEEGKRIADEIIAQRPEAAAELEPQFHEVSEEKEEDLIEELRVLVSEATDFAVDFAVADKIFTDDGYILKEADYWGASDTVVREGSCNVFAEALIGRRWPKYGDGLTDEEFNSFTESLKTAHDELLAELKAAQKD